MRLDFIYSLDLILFDLDMEKSDENELNPPKYVCINCGNAVKCLFKQYSSTVLKLTSCVSYNFFL